MKKAVIFIVFLLLLSFLGFLKERYLVRVGTGGIDIVPRYRVDPELLVLPEGGGTLRHNIVRNPKWVSSLVYTIIFGLVTVWGIHLLFNRRMYNLIAGGFYVTVLLISGFIILLSALLDSFETGYLAGQYLKNLVQSPLVLMVLVFVFHIGRSIDR